MTYQRDPDLNPLSGRRDHIRRDDGSYSPLPIIFGVALMVAIGFFVISSLTGTDRGPNVQRSDAPNTTSVPRTTPTNPPK